MLKIRRPLGRLIFNMGIAIPGKTVFLIETAPRCFLWVQSLIYVLPFLLSCCIQYLILDSVVTSPSSIFQNKLSGTTLPINPGCICTGLIGYMQLFIKSNFPCCSSAANAAVQFSSACGHPTKVHPVQVVYVTPWSCVLIHWNYRKLLVMHLYFFDVDICCIIIFE